MRPRAVPGCSRTPPDALFTRRVVCRDHHPMGCRSSWVRVRGSWSLLFTLSRSCIDERRRARDHTPVPPNWIRGWIALRRRCARRACGAPIDQSAGDQTEGRNGARTGVGGRAQDGLQGHRCLAHLGFIGALCAGHCRKAAERPRLCVLRIGPRTFQVVPGQRRHVVAFADGERKASTRHSAPASAGSHPPRWACRPPACCGRSPACSTRYRSWD